MTEDFSLEKLYPDSPEAIFGPMVQHTPYAESIQGNAELLEPFRKFMAATLVPGHIRDEVNDSIADKMSYFFRHDEISYLEKLIANPVFARFLTFHHEVAMIPAISFTDEPLDNQDKDHHALLLYRFYDINDRPHLPDAKNAYKYDRTDGPRLLYFAGDYDEALKKAFLKNTGIQDFLNKKWLATDTLQKNKIQEDLEDAPDLQRIFDQVISITGLKNINEVIETECERRRVIEEQEIWAAASQRFSADDLVDIVMQLHEKYTLPESESPNQQHYVGNLWRRFQEFRGATSAECEKTDPFYQNEKDSFNPIFDQGAFLVTEIVQLFQNQRRHLSMRQFPARHFDKAISVIEAQALSEKTL
jgi:hypothetical protein